MSFDNEIPSIILENGTKRSFKKVRIFINGIYSK